MLKVHWLISCRWTHGAREINFAFEDAIGFHACSLEACMRVTNSISLVCPLPLTVRTFYDVSTPKVQSFEHAITHDAAVACMDSKVKLVHISLHRVENNDARFVLEFCQRQHLCLCARVRERVCVCVSE
jgi:hypothetical protein